MLKTLTDTDVIKFGAGSSVDNLDIVTALGWVYLDSYISTVTGCMLGKIDSAGFTGYRTFLAVQDAGQLYGDYARATQDGKIVSATGVVPLKKPTFICTRWDSSLTNADQQGFYGFLNAAPREVPSYTTQRVGSGATKTDDTFELSVGNSATTQTFYATRASFAWMALYNRRLSNAEIWQWWNQTRYNLMPSNRGGLVFLVNLGNSYGQQTDLSGNSNHGTITGATVSHPFSFLPRALRVKRAFIPTLTNYTLTCASGSFAMTGNAQSLLWNRKIAAAAGSYSMTGNAANLLWGHKIALTAGSYSVTGNDVILKRTYINPLAAGSYSLTGNATGLLWGHTTQLTAGAFNITGNSQSLLWNHNISLTSGSYSLTGNATNLLWGHKIALTAGAFNITGNAVTLKADRKLTANSGTFNMTGNAVTLNKGSTLIAASGVFNITGNAVQLKRTYQLPLVSGSYSYTGYPVILTATVASVLARCIVEDNLVYMVLPSDEKVYDVAIKDELVYSARLEDE